jgi:hypothetical protein
MRTPESDESGSEGAGTLADGFGTVVDDDSDDTNFGEGSGDDESTAALQATPADDLIDDEETQVFLDPSDSYTDTDLDLNGDGLVDGGDFHTAVSDFFDVSVDDDGSYDDGADEPVDPIHDAPDAGFDDLFGLFGG